MKKLLIYITMFIAFATIAMWNVAIRKLDVYFDRVRYVEFINKHLIEVSADDDPYTTLQEGQIVWITGYLTTDDTLKCAFENCFGDVVERYSDTIVYAECDQEQLHKGNWSQVYYHKIASSRAHIGEFYLKRNLIYYGIGTSKDVYTRNHSETVRYIVKILPRTNISLIAQWKNGRLDLISNDNPLPFSLKANVPANVLMEHIVPDARLDAIIMIALATLVTILLLVIVYSILRNKKKQTSNIDKFISDEIKHLNKIRIIYLSVLFLIPAIPCLLLIFYIPIQHIDVECLAVIISFYGILLAFEDWLLGSFLEKKYNGKYKEHVIETITLLLREVISKEEDANVLSKKTFNNLGITEAREDTNEFLGPGIYYQHRTEDEYLISNSKLSFEFFEFYIKEVKHSGRSKITNIVFRSFCMKFPLCEAKGIRLNIETKNHTSFSGLKPYDNYDTSVAPIPPEMHILMDDNEENKNFLTQTPFIENISMIQQIIATELSEKEMVFAVYEEELYVFVITDKNRFDMSLFSSIDLEMVKNDITAIQSMCHIARRYI